MNFYDEMNKYTDFDYEKYLNKITDEEINNVLSKEKLNIMDFLALLSPAASNNLEIIARKANELSIQYFGKSILLYTPMYLSNYCINRCAYCTYNTDHHINRKKLSLEEIENEAKIISETGLRHILILTGESNKVSPVEYIKQASEILKKYFDSICIEIYPLTEEEYKDVIKSGVDSVTVYQEVYDKEIYDKVHISGPKKDYLFRLETPERACKAGMRNVNIGALLGLNDWRKEAFMTGLHAEYLQNKYDDVEISISLPRIRPHVGVFEDVYPVNDADLVQILLALRVFLPFQGITLSTREREGFREQLIPLGITKISAGVTTEVGGHSSQTKGEAQFEISDTRSVNEMKEVIKKKGYQPIFKDWMQIG